METLLIYFYQKLVIKGDVGDMVSGISSKSKIYSLNRERT